MINLTSNAAQKVKGILEQEKESIPRAVCASTCRAAAAPASSTAWSSTRRPTATRSSSSRA